MQRSIECTIKRTIERLIERSIERAIKPYVSLIGLFQSARFFAKTQILLIEYTKQLCLVREPNS